MSWRLSACLALLVLCSPAISCLKGPNFAPSRDEALFYRANDALASGRLDVAELTLLTLIHTYPKSDYATKAKSVMGHDPRLSCHTADDMDFFIGFRTPCDRGTEQ